MKQTQLLRNLTLALMALFLAATARASLIWYGDPNSGTSVFKAIDIEDSNNNYQGNPSPNGSSITTFTDPTYGASWQMYKAVNDKRAEAHGAAGFNPATGNTYYIGWRFNLNSTVTDNAIFQWKAYGSPMYQNFPIVLKCVNGALQLHYYSSNVVDHLVWSQSISTGTWYSGVIEIKVSSSWTGGSISFWLNGTQVVNGYTARTFDGSSVDPKWGIYGATSTQVTDQLNSIKIGTTYNDVTPGGGGGGFSGTYELQNVASGLVLNNQGSLTNGSAITQWAELSNPNLEWTFIATSGGYYQINSVKSGLDAVVQSASTANGAGIIQWSFGSSGDDQWQPTLNGNGSYTFYNLHSGLVLEDPGSSKSDTTQMDQWSANGGANQQWNLLKQ
jgi:hypothetical protein